MRETIIITIASQKGGIGKSKFASIISTMLSYEYGLKVLLFDMDKQQTLMKKRREDLIFKGKISLQKKQNKTSEELNSLYTNDNYISEALDLLAGSNMPAYHAMPINDELSTDMAKIMDTLQSIKRRGEFMGRKVDVIICDTPGALDSKLLEVLTISDGILTPMVGSKDDLHASATFLLTLKGLNRDRPSALPAFSTKRVFAVANKKQGIKEEEHIPLLCAKPEINIPLFESYFSNLVDYQRFSTILSHARTDGVYRKSAKEVWKFIVEFTHKMGIVKNDLSDFSDWFSPDEQAISNSFKIGIKDAYRKFLQDIEEDKEEIFEEESIS